MRSLSAFCALSDRTNGVRARVDVFRFDPEVSIPIDAFGSRFRIGPLTGPDSRVRAHVFHVPAGGGVGRHKTTVQQLFAVVAGEAVVSGADGTERTIGPGYAARWAVGLLATGRLTSKPDRPKGRASAPRRRADAGTSER